jgi:membrane associated rhomboid family serine protease
MARWPVVTVLLIAANAYAFFLELNNGERFVYAWSVIPRNISHGYAWPTLLTATFLHAGWSHIIGNMIFLWAFGPAMEDAMGRVRYLFFYLIGGVIAMATQVAAMPQSTVPNLGASGAIAAVMGAFLVTYPRDRIRTAFFFLLFIRVTYIPAVLLIGVWFVIQLFSAGEIAGHVQGGGVAYLAHIGGFLFGLLTARLWVRSRR